MFYLPKQKNTLSHEVAVAPGAVFQAEGQAAVRVKGNTAAGVAPSTGTANDIFAGFVIAGTSAAPFAEAYTNRVETYVVPSTGQVTLSRTPVSGQVAIWNDTDGAAVPIASGVSVTGAVVAGLTAGDQVTITYKFALTVAESVTLQGDVQPGGYAGARVGQIGVVTRGTIYTSEFDASKDWAAATAIKLGANGQLTDHSGSGVAIPGFVVALPTGECPFLGIEFDVL